ncbi:hypothetical protein DACRYDRAFT_22645 [Dacryopinax primogenitus]|uniref:PQ-loop-domain-containing protein n=1 Tax=Dacryopinax primogenitus (strain DJM 731) TaxID=1858805 RepID=M5GBZ3_DACPD|nr:uncharacterized protein DACRYDRAFT_22645 [Dacryopinax primogenitus]EJU01548.1 hypothetical protein DACRYDRAFT_22645 [Dacryopinax primogenitus]
MDLRISDEPVCKPAHDPFTLLLTCFLCFGIIISYIPQHWRIIAKQTSEGISPWYLLLGSTSAAAGMLNVVTLQWGVVRCCSVWTVGQCLENTIGIVQVTILWAMFSLIVVLFLLYYPPSARHHHIRHVREYTDEEQEREEEEEEEIQELLVATAEWNEAKALCALVLVHLIISIFVTFFLVLSSPPPSQSIPSRQAELWAGFCGITASLFACFQYAPQLWKTYKDRLVGALSIPMMCIQCPGAVLFIVSLAVREGTNWTSWLPYAAAGIMQGLLLILCIVWKVRQARLGIDDFGNPLSPPPESHPEPSTWGLGLEFGNGRGNGLVDGLEQGESGPPGLGLPELDGQQVEAAWREAEDRRAAEAQDGEAGAGETTPLIVRATTQTGKVVLPWLSWGRRR